MPLSSKMPLSFPSFSSYSILATTSFVISLNSAARSSSITTLRLSMNETNLAAVSASSVVVAVSWPVSSTYISCFHFSNSACSFLAFSSSSRLSASSIYRSRSSRRRSASSYLACLSDRVLFSYSRYYAISSLCYLLCYTLSILCCSLRFILLPATSARSSFS